jgi:hypothetical protein
MDRQRDEPDVFSGSQWEPGLIGKCPARAQAAPMSRKSEGGDQRSLMATASCAVYSAVGSWRPAFVMAMVISASDAVLFFGIASKLP